MSPEQSNGTSLEVDEFIDRLRELEAVTVTHVQDVILATVVDFVIGEYGEYVGVATSSVAFSAEDVDGLAAGPREPQHGRVYVKEATIHLPARPTFDFQPLSLRTEQYVDGDAPHLVGKECSASGVLTVIERADEWYRDLDSGRKAGETG